MKYLLEKERVFEKHKEADKNYPRFWHECLLYSMSHKNGYIGYGSMSMREQNGKPIYRCSRCNKTLDSKASMLLWLREKL